MSRQKKMEELDVKINYLINHKKLGYEFGYLARPDWHWVQENSRSLAELNIPGVEDLCNKFSKEFGELIDKELKILTDKKEELDRD